ETVATERHDHVALLRRRIAVAVDQAPASGFRRLAMGRDKGNLVRVAHPVSRDLGGHQPPVTLIWRGTAGAARRRSMTKSWPLGLRWMASRIAASSVASLSDCRSGARRSAAAFCPRHM